MVRDTGTMPITSANEMNIPVICMLHEPDRENGLWSWAATNFMPRKEYCGSSYCLEADTKEELLAEINKYVTPLYETALANIKERGYNYYWELPKA